MSLLFISFIHERKCILCWLISVDKSFCSIRIIFPIIFYMFLSMFC
nr:MAG TPA: hypothetical protein [Caudoviricetes sp.]